MAANTNEHTTQTADQGVLASLGLDTGLFISQVFNFILVFLVIWFLLLKPLVKKLQERQEIIDESLDKAKEVESNLLMSEEKYKETLNAAKKEANGIIEAAHEKAEVLAVEMKEKAKKDIDMLIVQAKKKIGEERESAVASVKEEASELIVLALERIVSKQLGKDADKRIIEDTLKSLK